MKHSTIVHAASGRNQWAGAAITLATIASLLMIFATANAATAAPDGPERVFALNANDILLRFDGDEPSDVTRIPITGLTPGTSLVGIDFRPSAQPTGSPNQGQLYGVSDDSFIYTINRRTGAATQGPQLRTDAANPATVVPLAGTSFGIDFNPEVDRLRIVSDGDQNLRVNVDTGLTIIDSAITYADPANGVNPSVGSVAYRNAQPAAFNSDPATSTTELYDIDSASDSMYEQDPPNNGTLVLEGPLGRDIQEPSGFDIVTRGESPAGDRGFAALIPASGDASSFFSVNLDTGDVMRIGRIANGNATVEGIAIPINQR